MNRKALLIVPVILGLVGGVALSAHASLLTDINKALRQAGIAVTGRTQLGWAEGIVTGHYKNYQQLVDAMKFHKGQGKSVPDSSKFTKSVTAIVAGGAQKIKAEVVSMSTKAITVRYKSGGKIVTKTFSFTKKQFDKAVGRSISRGSQVQIVVKGGRVLGNVVNRAPAGQEATYGSTSAGGGGGGGGT